MTGSSTQAIKTVLYPVSDLATVKAVHAALLGVTPQMDESYDIGFTSAGQQIGLVPGGAPLGMTSPVAYRHVQDLETKLAEVTATGAIVQEPPDDPGGNVLGLLQDRRVPTQAPALSVIASPRADQPASQMETQ